LTTGVGLLYILFLMKYYSMTIDAPFGLNQKSRDIGHSHVVVLCSLSWG